VKISCSAHAPPAGFATAGVRVASHRESMKIFGEQGTKAGGRIHGRLH
jgi:hypothetical protein